MIIFLYGEDNYRSLEKLRKIIDHYKKIHKSGLNLSYLEGDKIKFLDFKNILDQASIFDEKKLIVLSNFFSNNDFKNDFIKNIKIFKEAEEILVLYEKIKINESDNFLKKIKDNAKKERFDFLTGEKLKKWLKEKFLELNAEIEVSALNQAIDFIGNDLWRFSNEIKKIVNYRLGLEISQDFKKGFIRDFSKIKLKIRESDISLLVKPKIEKEIFKTIDALGSKNKKRALFLLCQHLGEGDNPSYLLSMIAFQMRNLLVVKELIEKNQPYYSILKLTGLHPFVLKKTYQQSTGFTLLELKKIYQRISQADFEIKTGKVSPETALGLIISQI